MPQHLRAADKACMKKFLILLALFANFLNAQEHQPNNELNQQLSQHFWIVQKDKQVGTPQELSQLLAQGADPNYRVDPHYDDTLLDKLAYNDKYHEHLQILIAHGSRINKRKYEGAFGTYCMHSNALHHAAIGGAPQNALALLNAGADVHAVTTFGDTPLHLLIKYAKYAYNSEKRSEKWPRFVTTAQILINNGTRMDIATGEKEPEAASSPIQLAINVGLPELVELFRKKIAGPEYQTLQSLKNSGTNTYFSLLPSGLLQEISYIISNEEFLAQQQGNP